MSEFEAIMSERDRIIGLIERRICFDALADPDGRCEHHGGKCYDLRELINKLKTETRREQHERANA